MLRDDIERISELLWEQPGDRAARCVLSDALQDAGRDREATLHRGLARLHFTFIALPSPEERESLTQAAACLHPEYTLPSVQMWMDPDYLLCCYATLGHDGQPDGDTYVAIAQSPSGGRRRLAQILEWARAEGRK